MYKYIFRLSAFTTKVVEILKKLCILHNFILTKKVHVNQEAIHLRSKSRGHTLKIKKQRSRLNVRKHFFTNRIVDLWNNLTEEIISAKNLNTFKNRLDKYWANQPMKYDFEAEYEFITRSESSKIQYEEEQVNWYSSASIGIHRYPI